MFVLQGPFVLVHLLFSGEHNLTPPSLPGAKSSTIAYGQLFVLIFYMRTTPLSSGFSSKPVNIVITLRPIHKTNKV